MVNSSPGSTQTAIGMSGCHRLWIASLVWGLSLRSTEMRVSDMGFLLLGLRLDG